MQNKRLEADAHAVPGDVVQGWYHQIGQAERSQRPGDPATATLLYGCYRSRGIPWLDRCGNPIHLVVVEEGPAGLEPIVGDLERKAGQDPVRAERNFQQMGAASLKLRPAGGDLPPRNEALFRLNFPFFPHSGLLSITLPRANMPSQLELMKSVPWTMFCGNLLRIQTNRSVSQ